MSDQNNCHNKSVTKPNLEYFYLNLTNAQVPINHIKQVKLVIKLFRKYTK